MLRSIAISSLIVDLAAPNMSQKTLNEYDFPGRRSSIADTMAKRVFLSALSMVRTSVWYFHMLL
jgi:hypothetical protein